MKIILYAMVALISFIASLAAALALTGNLSKETLDRMMGKESAVTTPSAVAPPPQSDSVGPLVQQLKKKEESLKKREQELNEQATQLDQRQQELERMRTDLEGMQKQIQTAVQDADKERDGRLQAIAITISEMKPDKAAERLKGMSAQDVAEILGFVKPKDRGKIVEAMEADMATRVLRALQERKI